MSFSQSVFLRLSKFLSKRKLFLTRSLNFKKEQFTLETSIDFVRYATLELCCNEIKAAGVPGNLAELGVFQGEFSKRINQLFPDRQLYLFDTFKGFSAADVAIEQEKNYSEGTQDFSQTSVELVRAKMPFPERCIFKPGYFPATAEGVADRFCFVSIDADLYEPIYQGLKFFYPRLENGGYIFIHDYNNDAYAGARDAVRRFCRENEISFVPVPDSGGTAIIAK